MRTALLSFFLSSGPPFGCSCGEHRDQHQYTYRHKTYIRTLSRYMYKTCIPSLSLSPYSLFLSLSVHVDVYVSSHLCKYALAGGGKCLTELGQRVATLVTEAKASPSVLLDVCSRKPFFLMAVCMCSRIYMKLRKNVQRICTLEIRTRCKSVSGDTEEFFVSPKREAE